MQDIELTRIIEKSAKLRALQRARARVRQLERELRGAPLRLEEPLYVPEFLRRRSPFGITRLPSPAQPRAVLAPPAGGLAGYPSAAERAPGSTAKAS